jgi:hypothetical protein
VVITLKCRKNGSAVSREMGGLATTTLRQP